VKEVLVVQAKKDTSELVKKKEEVTQERIPVFFEWIEHDLIEAY